MPWVPSTFKSSSNRAESEATLKLRELRSLLNKISPDNTTKVNYESTKLFQNICEHQKEIVPQVFRLFLEKSTVDSLYIKHYVYVLTNIIHQNNKDKNIKVWFLSELQSIFQKEMERKDKKRLKNLVTTICLSFTKRIVCLRILASGVFLPMFLSDEEEHVYGLYAGLHFLYENTSSFNTKEEEIFQAFYQKLRDKVQTIKISPSLKYNLMDLEEKIQKKK